MFSTWPLHTIQLTITPFFFFNPFKYKLGSNMTLKCIVGTFQQRQASFCKKKKDRKKRGQIRNFDGMQVNENGSRQVKHCYYYALCARPECIYIYQSDKYRSVQYWSLCLLVESLLRRPVLIFCSNLFFFFFFFFCLAMRTCDFTWRIYLINARCKFHSFTYSFSLHCL